MYKRVLLKFSGEALKGNDSGIFDIDLVKDLAKTIAALNQKGIQICVVIGAGNIWRGGIAEKFGFDRVPADFMGMLGTVINAVTISSALKQHGVDSIVTSAVPAIDGVTLPYSKELAIKALEENKVVFLSGGTGKPFFTTDTAATLRALELSCDAILMGKHGVDGVYDSDPNVNKDAQFLKEVTYNEIINRKLKVMDLAAVELIKDKDIQIRVFSMADPDNFVKVAYGDDMGSTCKKGE